MATSDWNKTWKKVNGEWKLTLTRKDEDTPRSRKKSTTSSSSRSRSSNTSSSSRSRSSSTSSSSSRSSSSSYKSYSTSNSAYQVRQKLKEKEEYEEARKDYEAAMNSYGWKKMREAILSRDGYECTECGSSDNLNVHHNYYVQGHAIWDYPPSALTTLCHDCHQEYHRTHSIPVYNRVPRPGEKLNRIYLKECPRCGGDGYLPQYSHVEDGVCFLCWGSGYRELHFGTHAVDVIDTKD
jgi:hypothetical protein